MHPEQLAEFVQKCEGALACVVMGFDGSAHESYTSGSGLNVLSVGMEFSFVLNQVRKAAEILEVGALEEVLIQSQRLCFVLRVLDEDRFIGMALQPGGNMGKARYLLRLARD